MVIKLIAYPSACLKLATYALELVDYASVIEGLRSNGLTQNRAGNCMNLTNMQ